MKKHSPALAVFLLVMTGALLPTPLRAQTTITYTEFEHKSTTYNTTGNPLTFSIDSSSATQSGIISGTGGITKVGAGTLTLSGANTFTGVTTLTAGTLSVATIGDGGVAGNLGQAANAAGNLVFNGGTLQYTGGTASSNRNFTINAGKTATFDVSHPMGNLTLSGTSTATNGAFTKIGAGTLTLSGANTYTGTTTVSAGTLVLSGGANRLPVATTLFLTNGATLDLGGNAQTIAGLGTFSSKIVGNITAGTLTPTGDIVLQSGTFANTFAGSSATARLWIGGDAAATVTLNGVNDGVFTTDHHQVVIGYAPVTGAAGIVRVGNANALAAATEEVHLYAGTLDLNGQAAVRGKSLNLLSGNASTLINANTTSAASFDSEVLISGGLVNIGGAGALSLGGVVSGTGGLTKIGTGTLTLSGANTFTGVTTLTAGTLSVATIGDGGVAGNLGQAWNATSNLVFNGGTLQYTGATASSNRNFTINAGKTATVDVATGATNLTLNGISTATTGALTKIGTGTLTLSGTNSYTGGTAVNAGTLKMANASALGSGTVAIASGATLDSATYGLFLTRLSGTGTLTGSGTYTYNSATDLTLASVLTGSAALTKSGAGPLTLSGANTFTGVTTLTSGTLSVATIGDGGVAGNLGQATNAAGNLVFNGGTLRYTGAFARSNRNFTINAGMTATIDVSNGTLVLSGASTATNGDLTKIGAGILSLSGANTYTGATTVSAGTLALIDGNNRLPVTTTLFLTNGAAFHLGGNQTIAGLGTFSSKIVGNITGGTLTPTGDIVLQSGTFANTFAGSSATARLWIGGDTAATVTLTGANDRIYTADHHQVVIGDSSTGAAGIVRVGNANALAAATEEVHLYAGTLDLNGQAAVRAKSLNLLSGSASTLINANTTSAASFDSEVLISGGPVNIGGAGALSLGGVVSGTGRLTKIGTGTLTLSGTNSYTGGTAVNAGTLKMANASALGSGTVAIASGATLDSATYGLDLTRLSGTGTLTGSGTYTYNSATDLTFAPVLAGSAALTKSGAGTLTLSGANTFTGVTTLTGGTLSVATIGDGGVAGNLGQATIAAGNLAFNGVTFYYTGATTSNLVFNGGTLQYTGATASSNRNFTINAGKTATVDVATGATNLTLNGISTATNGALTKIGTGTLTLSSANSYTGGTAVNGGTLKMANASALGSGIVVIASGATLDSATYGLDLTRLSGTGTLTGSGTYTYNSATDLTLASVLTGSAALTKSGAGTLTLSGANTFTGSLSLEGGILALGSTNALSNSPEIFFRGGTLQFSAANTRDYSGSFMPTAGMQYRLDSNGQNITLGTALASSGGSLTKFGAGTLSLEGNNTYSGLTTVDAGTLQIGTGGTTGSLAGAVSLNADTVLIFNRSNDVAPNHPIIGDGALIKLGAGTLTLTGANSYSGDTTISAGIVSIGHDFALSSSAVILNGGGLSASGGAHTLANTVTVNGDITFSGAQALTLSGAFILARNRDLTVSNSALTTISGVISQSGGGRGLNKYGAGELQLTGANTYTGGTYIGAGTVRINNTAGSAFGTGAVTVEAGATLAGAGSFTGAVQLNGMFSPGNSPGTATTGSQTWAGGGGYIWETNNATGLIGTNTDLLSISGTLTINATSGNKFTLSLVSLLANNDAGDVVNFNSATNFSYMIASATGGIIGFDANAFTINTAAFSNSLNGGTWSLALTNSNHDLALNFTASAAAIPEPSTYAMSAGALALALAMLRRRCRHA